MPTILRLRFQQRQGSIPRSSHANTVNCDVNSGYTVPMLVEDSRILEASIFSILHKSRLTTVVGRLLHDIITIADEVDSQLKQTMLSYTDRSPGTRSQESN